MYIINGEGFWVGVWFQKDCFATNYKVSSCTLDTGTLSDLTLVMVVNFDNLFHVNI